MFIGFGSSWFSCIAAMIALMPGTALSEQGCPATRSHDNMLSQFSEQGASLKSVRWGSSGEAKIFDSDTPLMTKICAATSSSSLQLTAQVGSDKKAFVILNSGNCVNLDTRGLSMTLDCIQPLCGGYTSVTTCHGNVLNTTHEYGYFNRLVANRRPRQGYTPSETIEKVFYQDRAQVNLYLYEPLPKPIYIGERTRSLELCPRTQRKFPIYVSDSLDGLMEQRQYDGKGYCIVVTGKRVMVQFAPPEEGTFRATDSIEVYYRLIQD